MPKVQRSGYSGKALHEKLGLKAGQAFVALGAPKDYQAWLELPRASSALGVKLGKDEKFIHAFFENLKAFKSAAPQLAAALAKDGMLWVSWRKGKASDLTEEPIRAWALAKGLVDVKVCSVSEEWSGLKIVWRKENR
jgi:hypothetical protein